MAGVASIALVGGGVAVAAGAATHAPPPPASAATVAAQAAAPLPLSHGTQLQASPAATLTVGAVATVREGGAVQSAVGAAAGARAGWFTSADTVQVSYEFAAHLVGADLHNSTDVEASVIVGMRQVEARATAIHQQTLAKLSAAGITPTSFAGKILLADTAEQFKRELAIELDGANKYAAALGSSSGLDDLAHATGAEWLWSARNRLPTSPQELTDFGCERVAPVIALGLVAGPTGIAIFGPAATLGRRRTVYQVGTSVYETVKSGDPEAILLEAGKIAAPYVGRLIGWACSLLSKFGLDVLVELLDRFAGPVLRVALRLYRASGARYVVGQLKDFGRVSWHLVASGIHKLTGLGADALDLIGADDAWDAVTGVVGGALHSIGIG